MNKVRLSENSNALTPCFQVCLISSAHRALDTRMFTRQAASLSNAGYKVTVVGLHDKKESIDGINIFPLENYSGKINRIVCNSWKVLKLSLYLNMDLYHFHDFELIPVGLILKIFGKKVIYDVHEDYEHSLVSPLKINKHNKNILGWLIYRFELFSSYFMDYVIAADTSIQSKFLSKKTERVTNYPPLLPSLTRSFTDRKTFRIVFVGSITEDHGARKIMEMFQYLKHREIVSVDLIGSINSPSLEKDLRSIPEIIYHGRLPWLKACDILSEGDLGLFIHQPNQAYLRLSGEGVTKLFEYMNAGLPVLYSNFPNLVKLITPLGCGRAVDPTNSCKIAQEIDELIESPYDRIEMGKKGRQAVVEKYNWENESKKLIGIYCKVLKEM